MSEFFFTNVVECSKYSSTTHHKHNHTMTSITLQIPYDEYGPLATLAAAANMPLDKYIQKELVEAKKAALAEKAENKED